MFKVTFNGSGRFDVNFNRESIFNAQFENVIYIPEHQYNFGNGLAYNSQSNTVSVDVVDDAIDGETRPITSNGVYKEIGNISVMLSTI